MRVILLFAGLMFHSFLFAQQSASTSNIVGTYSIVARDSLTGDLGVAVQSKFLGVGSVVPFARAGVGAIATQAWANTEYGPQGLSLLEVGKSAQEVVNALTLNDPDANQRQVGIVDAHGGSFAFTGQSCQSWAGQIIGKGYTVQGNILAGGKVSRKQWHECLNLLRVISPNAFSRLWKPAKPQAETNGAGNPPRSLL